MPDLDSQLTRWQSAGVLDAETASRIRALESEGATEPSAHAAVAPSIATPAGLKWLVVTGLILGAILLACGVVLFVSAHWDQLGPAGRYLLVIAMVAVFHIAGGLTRSNFEGLSSALHAVGTISTGAAIALVGQIFNIQEHWPAAVLLWALAALAGWAASARPGAANAGPPPRSRMDLFRTRLPHGGPHRQRRLHGPPLLPLGHPLPHLFCRLAAQGGAGNSLRGERHRRRHRHRISC